MLRKNYRGVLYLDNYFFIEKLIFNSYVFILYGGFGFVMVKVCEIYWVFFL